MGIKALQGDSFGGETVMLFAAFLLCSEDAVCDCQQVILDSTIDNKD
jgi:hypothetical protein